MARVVAEIAENRRRVLRKLVELIKTRRRRRQQDRRLGGIGTPGIIKGCGDGLIKRPAAFCRNFTRQRGGKALGRSPDQIGAGHIAKIIDQRGQPLFLGLTPASNKSRVKLRKAWRAAPLVALLSLTKWIGPVRATSSIRCGRPVKVSSAASIWGAVSPNSRRSSEFESNRCVFDINAGPACAGQLMMSGASPGPMRSARAVCCCRHGVEFIAATEHEQPFRDHGFRQIGLGRLHILPAVMAIEMIRCDVDHRPGIKPQPGVVSS